MWVPIRSWPKVCELTITLLLHVMLNWDDTLVSESLDFGLTVGLPVVDVFVLAYSQRSASKYDCSH